MTDAETVSGVTTQWVEQLVDEMVYCYRSYLEVGPHRFVMPSAFADWYPSCASFTVRQDDVWVITFPKAGTTWCQELVWCLLNDPESPQAKFNIRTRFPFFEFDSLLTPDMLEDMLPTIQEDDPRRPGNIRKILQTMASPRTIKSHLLKDLLPSHFWQIKPKVVYVARDPRDVAVSYYYHYLRAFEYSGTWEKFISLFLDDKLMFCPYWRHVLDFWEVRNEEHVLFLRFEEMKEDLEGVARRVAAFLGQEVDEGKVARLIQHCSFDQMRANPATNYETAPDDPSQPAPEEIKFMRKGEVGDWKNHLTESQQRAFKDWTLRHLEGSDFPYYRDYL